MATSPEHDKLYRRLGEWFATDQGFGEPVITSRGSDRREQLWQIRAGFVGETRLCLQGLAVVVRKRLPPREGLYRADVYEPTLLVGSLPLPDAMAGRVVYGPNSAGYAFSTDPDIVPASPVPKDQYAAMHHLLDFVTLQPAVKEEIVCWAERYQRLP